MRFKHLIIAILLFLPLTAQAALDFPALTGRVVDSANIINPQTKTQLESLLAAYEQQTANQIVVVTLPSLQGHTIENYGYQLGRHWGIDTKEKNNGILFIIAPKEQSTWIKVGYGLEGVLTDALTKLIIENDILPYFKQGDYSGGILRGTQSIISVAEGKTSVSYVNTSEETESTCTIYIDGKPGSPIICYAADVLVYVIKLLMLLPIVVLFSWFNARKRIRSDGSSWSGGGIRISVRNSGGGGGFRGGGGSFGGGGSSGRW